MPTYHYYATYRRHNNSLVELDGIAETNYFVTTKDDYNGLKESIVGSTDLITGPFENLTICSLTVLKD